MKREIILSEDGSPTIYVEELDEHYHSVFGARSESEHIFINAGLNYFDNKNIEQLNILEIGLGTGLNAYLSAQNINSFGEINYYAIEKYPLKKKEWKKLGYISPEDKHPQAFYKIHESDWETWTELIEGFNFYKTKTDLRKFIPPPGIDLVYFDAFAPEVQPELWSKQIFSGLYKVMQKGAVLVSYSVKGMVKQNLRDSGFIIEKLKGPRGKRHMLRAIK